MARRALLIGAQTAGLTGISNDLDILSRLLGHRGFEIIRHENDEATRDAIVAALQLLAVETVAGDVIAVYITCHGGLVRNSGEPLLGIAEELNFLVPTDFADSTESDFRGLTGLELSGLMAALTDTTPNVTIILDCCYSGRIARQGLLTPKSWPEITYTDVVAHLQRRGLVRLSQALPDNVVSNPDLVRLVASGPSQEANESNTGKANAVGLFTTALDRFLTAAGDAPLTWTQLVDRIRRWVQFLSSQRPEAEGPADRLLFQVEKRVDVAVLPVREDGGQVEIGGGVLHDVGVGDLYGVLDAAHPDLAAPAAVLTVRAVSATAATVDVQLAAGVTALPTNGEAHPLSRVNRRRQVALDGTGPEADLVTTRLLTSKFVQPADPAGGLDTPLVTVRVTATGYTLFDAAGQVTAPYPATVSGADDLVADIDRLARAAAVRALGRGDIALDDTVEVEWGRVVAGQQHPLPPAGGVVFETDRIYLRLRNRLRTGAPPENRYLFAFSADSGGQIGMISADQPSGIPLLNERTALLGLRDEISHELRGFPISWPLRVLRDGARPEALLVISTDTQHDLNGLAQAGIAGPRLGTESRLQQLLLQIADGGPRSETAPTGGLRWAARHLDYLFVPADRPKAEQTVFALDESPDLMQLVLTPASTPGTVTVHLDQLRLAPDRVPGAAGVRLDALAVSEPEVPGEPVTLRTATWRAAGAGAAVVITDRTLAEIVARDRLHLALWISPDAPVAPDLAELVDSPPALPANLPPVATVAAALGAVAAVVDGAAAALTAATGRSAGIYRSCWLGEHDYGAGSHPGPLSPTAPGVELRLRVETTR